MNRHTLSAVNVCRCQVVNVSLCCLDVLVWTSDHVIQWVESIGLGEYTAHLKNNGVHGGVLALDHDFDYEKLALMLQIPLTSPEVGTGQCLN